MIGIHSIKSRSPMFTTANLSVQLYTLREALAEDLDAVLERVAEIGYRNVEPFGLLDYADRLAESLPRHGLAAPTTHAGVIGQDQNRVFHTAAALGVQIVIHPAVEAARWADDDSIQRIAEDLNRAASVAAGYGVQVGYHNHYWELQRMVGDRHALEVLASHLSPDVVLEVDTYWAFAGGSDVPALLGRLGDRVVALHLKDGDGSLEVKTQVAVGAGALPVWDFVNATTNLRYGVVELDDSAGDRFAAVADSFAYHTRGDGR
jgi:sugar phosphate isomerase/epimerase